MNLTTEADLATEHLGITPEKAAKLRREKGWPHVRLSRFDIRYTDAQIEQIVAMMTVAPRRSEKGRAKIPGQTARSAARSS